MALDPVNAKAVKGKFKDREDKDLDNDGDSDASDEYLHKRRSAVSKAIKSVKEAAPKIGVDNVAKIRAQDHANKPAKVKPMNSTQRSLASIRAKSESVEEAKMTPDQMRKALDDDKANAKSKDKVSLKKAPWDMKESVELDEAKRDASDFEAMDPPNGIDYDDKNLRKLNWKMYDDKAIRDIIKRADSNADERSPHGPDYQSSGKAYYQNIIKAAKAELKKRGIKEEVELDEANLSQQQRDRLDDLIFNVMITGNIEYDGKDNPTRHLKTIEKEFGPKVAKQVEAGMDIKNWGRDNRSSGIDSLALRKKSRISASGKMNKQDAVALGKRIMQDKSFGGLTKKVKLPEDTQIDEISMTKMAAYADKAVKSRNDAKAATHSADSNRVVNAKKVIAKRKAGADNYNKKMWGYGNVAPTKESIDAKNIDAAVATQRKRLKFDTIMAKQATQHKKEKMARADGAAYRGRTEDTQIDEKYDTPVKKKPVSMMTKDEKDKNDERRKSYKEYQKSLRKEDTQIDEISMGKMAAYADKAVKSRNDAKAATYSADSNRRDKAQKTIVKRKAGADNYNKKMWGYSNVAPTKESVSRVFGRMVEAKSGNMIHIGHPDDYTDDAWKHEVFIAGKKVTSGSHFKLDGKNFQSVDAFVRVLAKKYNVPETSFALYSFDDNGKNPKLYQKAPWKPRDYVRESNESVSRVLSRMVEAKDNYTIAHKTFSSAVQHAEDVTKKRGFEIDPDVWDRKVAMGPRKPGVGKTNSYNIDLMKNGKDVKQKLHMQVYYDEGRYELNMYIS